MKKYYIKNAIKICLFVICLFFFNGVAAQDLISIDKKNITLDELLTELRKQTGYDFVSLTSKFDFSKKISPKFKNENLYTVLDQYFNVASGVVYVYRNNSIVLMDEEKATYRTVVGQVLNATTAKPMAGVTVSFAPKNIRTRTNEQGQFGLGIPEYAREIEASFLGYEKQVLSLSPATNYIFQLSEKSENIDEVVVTGMFDKSKESFTGAVTKITAEQLDLFKGQNLIQTLANIDPAIRITANNVSGSNPNQIPQITIRGRSSLSMDVEDYQSSLETTINSPLILLDGFEITMTRLMDLNVDDIESINVLKDASATAIYGSRGTNGVIVVISKRPKESGKLRVSASIGSSLELPDLTTYDLLNAKELLQLQYATGLYTQGHNLDVQEKYTQAYESRLKDVAEGVDTDWLHYPVRTGISTNTNVRLDGGSQEFRWGLSSSYGSTKGAMKGSERNNFNGALDLSYTYKTIQFRNMLTLGLNKSSNSPYGSFSTYANMMPYYRPYDENGQLIKTFMGFYADAGLIGNPLYNATLENMINESNYTNLANNLNILWDITPQLKLRTSFGISKNTSESDNFTPPEHTNYESINYQSDENFFRRGSYTYGFGSQFTYNGNINLSYSKVLNEKHVFFGGLNYEMRENSNENFSVTAEGFAAGSKPFLGNAWQYPEGGKPSATESISRGVGLTGNINYSYDSRYFADFVYRTDGSSQFGIKNKFAPFWSAGFGWNVNKEKFFVKNDYVSNLRLRGSYGITGSQNFAAYQANQIYQYFTSDRYLNFSGAYLLDMGNETLKWQQTNQLNLGIDMSLLEDRFTFNFNYYVKTTQNLLSSIELPLATGFTSYIENIGKVQNKGIEASVSTYIIQNKANGFSWNINASISRNRDKILKLSDIMKERTALYKAQDVETNTLFYEGYSQNALWLVPSLGIDPSTGVELFLDTLGNVTDTYSASNRVYYGVKEPIFNGNINTMLRYKGFILNLNFGYSWGGTQYNTTLRDRVEVEATTLTQRNVDRRVLMDRWMQPGDVVFFRRIEDQNFTNHSSTRFAMKESFLRLSSASLQYRLTNIRRIGLQSLTFGLNTSDVFYWSTIKQERGTDYPFARRVGLTLSTTF